MTKQIPLAIQYANLLPAKQGEVIILPFSHLPAGISYHVADLYKLAGFKQPTTTFFNIWTNWLKYCGDVEIKVYNDLIWLDKVAIIL